MGCTSSTGKNVENIGSVYNYGEDENEKPRWRKKLSTSVSKEEHVKDGTLPTDASDSLVAIRVFLEDPFLLAHVATYAQELRKMDLLLCWIEVLEYKLIPDDGVGYKVSKANGIYHKYVRTDAQFPVLSFKFSLSHEEQNKMEGVFSLSERSRQCVLPTDLFDVFGQRCLLEIEESIFKTYRTSPEYANAISLHRDNYNKVDVGDFDFAEVLGEGGFGVVLRCRKKSTGVQYAMKVQCKHRLLNMYSQNPERVAFEKEALSKCHHPFIVSMDYAFQTSRLVIMVMSLGTGDNLSVLSAISEERALFYGAEIALGLDHIHKMGMIYRDLKPANVLLNLDGHIQLVDLGGVVDVEGNTLGTLGYYDDPNDEHAVLFNETPHTAKKKFWAKEKLNVKSASGLDSVDGSISRQPSVRRGREYSIARVPSAKTMHRALSVMGTGGFMAPEMLVQLVQSKKDRTGYTTAVDYWSLGVTLFILLTGGLPFKHQQVASFANYVGQVNADGEPMRPPEYGRVESRLNSLIMQHKVTQNCCDLVFALLQVGEKVRLGYGPKGMTSLMAHPAFARTDWVLLEQKLATPPPTGPVVVYGGAQGSVDASAASDSDAPAYDMKFNALMKSEAGNFLNQVSSCSRLPPKAQKCYSNWDFIAPSALRAEMTMQDGAPDLDAVIPVRSGSASVKKLISLMPWVENTGKSNDPGDSISGNSSYISSIGVMSNSFSFGAPTGTGPKLCTPTGNAPAASFGTTKNAATLAHAAGALRQLAPNGVSGSAEETVPSPS